MLNNKFISTYRHSIDAKGRLFLPAKQRSYVGESVYMTRGLDDCIFLFSEERWDVFVEALSNLPTAKSRKAVRFFSGNAAQSDIDSQGRITVPASLREITGIQKDVAIVGTLNRIEIWDSARWDEYNSQMTGGDISEMLEDIGM